MSHASELAKRHASELRGIADTLPGLFAEAAGALEERLGEAGLREWARIGLGLARLSPRSQGVAIAFFEASPAVGPFEVSAFSRWAEIAADLADRAPQAATAFLEATPAALAHLELEELEVWASQGRRLCRGGWKSANLAARFFRIGRGLLESLSLQVLDRVVDILARLAQRSDELASACLHDSPSLLARLAENDREPFLVFAQAVCSASWADTHRCFERGPDLLEPVRPEQRSGFLDLSAAAAQQAGPDGFSLFVAAAEALGTLDPEDQAEVVGSARELAPHGARAAIESVASAPEVRRRLGPAQARRWSEAGLELLKEGQAAEQAESYFRIESALAEEMLAELAPRAELTSIGGILRLYAKALSGEPILVQPTGALVGRKIGWAAGAATTTDGISIFLPPEIGLFGDRGANFQVYKVHTTHQAGRLEFGSFRYCFGVEGEHLPSSVRSREQQRLEADEAGPGTHPDRPAAVEAPSSPAVIPIQRFFDLFDDRRLVSELFTLVEDTRIDACVSREYPGIRRWLHRVKALESERRPDVRRMALRQAFVENLLRASLGRPDTIRWPKGLAARLERAIATLRLVERTGATVQDSAEAAAVLYDLAIAIPNLPPERAPAGWSESDEDAASKALGPGGVGLLTDEEWPEGEEVPYQSPDPLEYRGEFKPELVQLLEELADREGAEQDGASLTRDEILELLENSAEIEFAEGADEEYGDLDALLANIEHEAADRANHDDEDDGAGDEGTLWFRYDEWDFRANDYRPDWCRVGERTTDEGEVDFYDETLRRYHGLVVETRRQFERMRPEWLRRLKRLEDGHEIDLDQAIEFHADKKAGAGPLARFYTRRNKVQRDVAVAFLLDMSGSTNEEISQPFRLLQRAGPPPTAGGSGARQPPARSAEGGKRIIDIERESTVLVVEALEAIGDAYGIYGFSGQGRENVEFYVIKGLDEPFDDSVRRRIDKIEPKESTRMGPAIRHAISKLNDHDAKVKILILVSDGRPQDEEYGRVRREKEYAIHDTKQALLEAKRQRITPFLITVDSTGRDYLRQICDDMGYEVVADIESLPRRLPKLYGHLAAG
jgi:nitric oxide reductase activation protein